MSWKLVVGDAEFPLQAPKTVVGRSRSCDVRLREDTVSRLHAAFVFDDEGLLLEDLGSSNGTFLNGQRVMERQRVRPGDQLRFGSLKATLVGPEEAKKSSSEGRPRLVEATWDYTVGVMPFPPANPWWRLAALGLDAILYLLGSAIPFLPLAAMLVTERLLLRPETLPPDLTTKAFVAGGCGALWVIFSWYYWIHGWARRGGTPGLRLLQLRLTDNLFRQPIGYRRAWLRASACMATAATFGLGFLLMFLRKDRKALHDWLAGTQVVQRLAESPEANERSAGNLDRLSPPEF